MFTFGSSQWPARPPTPPIRKAVEKGIDEIIQSLDTSLGLDSSTALITPPSSSPTHEDVHEPTSFSLPRPKKIRFDPEPCEIPSDGPESETSSISRPNPSSKFKISSKSILKPFDQSILFEIPNSSDRPSPHQFPTFPAMLEHIILQLASPLHAKRLDAYSMLTNSLRAYESIPDAVAFTQKLPQMEQYLRRDLAAVSPVSHMPDTNLVTAAAKLTVLLFTQHKKVSWALSEEFLNWLAEDVIRILESTNTRKEIMKSQLLLLSAEPFCARILTSERAARIVKALVTVHERVSGQAILGLRLSIYSRLLNRHSKVMSATIRQWLPQILHGALSTISDVQTRAVDLGIKAADVFGKLPAAANGLNDFFDQSSAGDGSSTNFDHYEIALTLILTNRSPEAKLEVPRIWSMVILFLRDSQQTLQTWRRLGSWLKVIQPCFNLSNHKLGMRAFNAWTRFIIAIEPDLKTTTSISRILRQPILSQLMRSHTSDHSKQVTETALSAYCLLLYYAFRPSATDKQFSRYWEEYVVTVMDAVSNKNAAGMQRMCEVLSASLYDSSSLPLWNTERARSSTSNPLTPKDVPRLPPLWIRKNLVAVLPTIRMALTSQPQAGWNFGSHQSDQLRLWESLLRTHVQAGEKEISPSKETTKAAAQIIETLIEVTNCTNESLLCDIPNTSSATNMSWSLAKSAMTIMGPSPFLRRPPQPPKYNDATAINSTDSLIKPTQLPIVRVLQALGKNISPSDNAEVRIDLTALLSPCIESLQSRRLKLRLVKACTNHLIAQGPSGMPASSLAFIWRGVCDILNAILCEHLDRYSLSYDLQDDYRDVISIVEAGLHIRSVNLYSESYGLLERLVELVRIEAGKDAVLLGVYWPLLQRAQGMGSSWCMTARLDLTSMLLEFMRPLDRRALEATNEILHTSTAVRNSPGFEKAWFPALSSTINRTLVEAYGEDDVVFREAVQLLLKRVGAFSGSPANVHQQLFICTIQEGLAPWIEDEKQMVGAWGTGPVLLFVWKELLKVVTRLPQHDSATLNEIERVFCAGFRSQIRDIAVASVEVWNRTFGLLQTLEYPQQLKTILLLLQDLADIKVPSVEGMELQSRHAPETKQGSIDYAAVFPWFQTMNDAGPELLRKAKIRNANHQRTVPLLSATPIRMSDGPTPIRRGRTPPARLRHDDSQMDFIPIQSSPLPHLNDESQMITEHQEEVRQRQRANHGLLAGLDSSSPTRSAHRRARSPQEIQRRARLSTDGAQDEQTSPHALGRTREVEMDVPSSPLQNYGNLADVGTKNATAANDNSVKVVNMEDKPEKTLEATAEGSLPENVELPAYQSAQDIPNNAEAFGSDVFVDAAAHPFNDEAPNLSSPVRVSTSQAETALESPDQAVSPQPSLPNGPECEAVPPPEHGSERIEDSFIGPARTSSEPSVEMVDAHSHEISDGEDEADAVREKNNDVQETAQVVGDVGETTSNRDGSTEIIRAISHSPPKDQMARVHIPTPQRLLPSHDGTEMDRSTDSSSAVSGNSKTFSGKRKRTTTPSTVNPKKLRVSRSSRLPGNNPATATDDNGDEPGDTIVLGKVGPDTPSFYEVVREREASQSEVGSPQPKRTTRKSSTQTSSQPSSLKRSFTSYADDRAGEASSQVKTAPAASKLTTSRSTRRSPTESQAKRRRSTQPAWAPATTTGRRSGRLSLASNEPLSTGLPRSTRARRSTNRATVPSRQPSHSSAHAPADSTQEEQHNVNVEKEVEVRSSDFATSEDKQLPSQEPEDTASQEPRPATPRQSNNDASASSTPHSTSSQGSGIQNLKVKFQGLLGTLKRTFLGGAQHEQNRRELEDLNFALSREVVLAGRRTGPEGYGSQTR